MWLRLRYGPPRVLAGAGGGLLGPQISVAPAHGRVGSAQSPRLPKFCMLGGPLWPHPGLTLVHGRHLPVC